EKNLFLRRIPARMFVVLGPLLLALAAIGIYGVVAYTVSHRTSEIGIRLALGATASRLVAQIVGQTMRAVVVGATVGWLAAFMVAMHLSQRSISGVTIVVMHANIMVVAAMQIWLNASGAVRMDPSAQLRVDSKAR